MLKDNHGLTFFQYAQNPAIDNLRYAWFLIYGRWVQILFFIFYDWKKHLKGQDIKGDFNYEKKKWEQSDFWTSLNKDYSKLVGLEVT